MGDILHRRKAASVTCLIEKLRCFYAESSGDPAPDSNLPGDTALMPVTTASQESALRYEMAAETNGDAILILCR